VVDRCAMCGSEADLVAFDLLDGGVLCRSCRRGRPLTPLALDLVRRVLEGGLASALAEPEGPASAEVCALATEAMEVHLDRRLRSLRSSPA